MILLILHSVSVFHSPWVNLSVLIVSMAPTQKELFHLPDRVLKEYVELIVQIPGTVVFGINDFILDLQDTSKLDLSVGSEVMKKLRFPFPDQFLVPLSVNFPANENGEFAYHLSLLQVKTGTWEFTHFDTIPERMMCEKLKIGMHILCKEFWGPILDDCGTRTVDWIPKIIYLEG